MQNSSAFLVAEGAELNCMQRTAYQTEALAVLYSRKQLRRLSASFFLKNSIVWELHNFQRFASAPNCTSSPRKLFLKYHPTTQGRGRLSSDTIEACASL